MPSLPFSISAIRAFTLSVLALAWVPGPVQAAERVVINFGPFSRTIPVSSLTAFAASGTPDDELAPLLRRLSPEQQATLRTTLTASREVSVTRITQWFYDPMGDRALLFLGKAAQTEARLNGQQALRAAIIAAAAEDGSLSLIDVVRHFPTGTMHLDMAQVLTNAQQAAREAQATQVVVETIRQQSLAEAAQPPQLDLAALPDLTQPGPHGSRQTSWVLEDSSRNRTYPVEIVVPQDLATLSGPLPVVVISHGLGDRPTSFLDVANHLASHGFVVALPEHIGSNFAQQQAMLNGLDSESFRALEFLDRPLDVSFVLDELERQNASAFGGKLAIDQVVAVGHSFGGYTALVLGGATIDFQRLAQRCALDANLVIDAALLLECRALELRDQPEVVQQLGVEGVQDERIKLVMAFAPVSNLLGPQGMGRLQLPVMIFGGAFDMVAPVVPQQVSAFNWLTTPERYLYLAENTSHGTSFTRATSDLLNLEEQFGQSIDEALVLTRAVNKSLIVAFTQVYAANRPEYSPFLSADYIDAASVEPFRVHRVRTLPGTLEDQLE